MTLFDQFELPPEEDIEFIAETHRRRLVALLVDTSASMATTWVDGVRAIDALNRQLEVWLPTVRGEGLGNLRDVEFAVITFGAGGVTVASGTGTASAADGDAFVPAAQLTLAPLRAGGATPMTEAVELGLRLLEARRHVVQTEHSQQTGKLRMILISDGGPTDFEGNRSDDWRRLAARQLYTLDRDVTGYERKPLPVHRAAAAAGRGRADGVRLAVARTRYRDVPADVHGAPVPARRGLPAGRGAAPGATVDVVARPGGAARPARGTAPPLPIR